MRAAAQPLVSWARLPRRSISRIMLEEPAVPSFKLRLETYSRRSIPTTIRAIFVSSGSVQELTEQGFPEPGKSRHGSVHRVESTEIAA